MKLYLSGPMSGIESLNFPAFHEAAWKLRGSGYEVSNPADYGPGGTWKANMRRDLRDMLSADALAMLPNWRDSTGARLEAALAAEVGIPVCTLQYWFERPHVPGQTGLVEVAAPTEGSAAP